MLGFNALGAAASLMTIPILPFVEGHHYAGGERSVLNSIGHNRGSGAGMVRAETREALQRDWRAKYYAETQLLPVTRQQIRASERASAKRYGARPMRSIGKRPPESVFVVESTNRRGEDRVHRLKGPARRLHLARRRWIDHGVSGIKAHVS